VLIAITFVVSRRSEDRAELTIETTERGDAAVEKWKMGGVGSGPVSICR
jgi:hypothetical protein